MEEETAAKPQMRRSLLPVALSSRRNISSNPVMSMFQTSFLIRSDGLKSKLSGGCEICLLVSAVPASSSSFSCCCSSSFCSVSANLSLSQLAASHLILVCKVALLSSLIITSLSRVITWRNVKPLPSFLYLFFLFLFFSSELFASLILFPICPSGRLIFDFVNRIVKPFPPRRLRFQW